MLSTFARLWLFLSSYVPLFAIIAVTFWGVNWWMTAAFGALSVVATLYLFWFLRRVRHRARREVHITAVGRRDADLIGYVVTYIVPFLVGPTDDVRKWIGLGIFFSVLCVLHMRLNMLYTNPLLAILKYHLYEVTTNDNASYPLISKSPIVTPGIRLVVPIQNNVLVEVAHGTDRNGNPRRDRDQ